MLLTNKAVLTTPNCLTTSQSSTKKRLTEIALFLLLLLVFIFVFIVASSDARAQSPQGPSRETINFEWVQRLIESRNLTTIESVIPHLPQSYLKNFTLMKESSSSQGATPLAPRVILFGETAQSILTFNGAPDQKGFNTIEMIDFNDNTRSFEFRQIEFSSGKVRFSEKNPSACMGCHKGSNKELRPNWDTYPQWNKAYGADDDFPRDSEIENLKQFKSQRENSDRYKHLIIEPGSTQSPFSDIYKGNLRFRPNARLTALMARWNAKKIVRMMQSHPSYRVYRNLALFEEVAQPGQLMNILPSLDLTKHLKPEDAFEYGHGRMSLLDLIIKDMNFVAADWSLSFGIKNFGDPRNQHLGSVATYFEGSTMMWDLVKNEIWRDFISEHPSLQTAYRQARPYSSRVNQDLTVNYPLANMIDEIGGSIDYQALKKEVLYPAVLSELRREIITPPAKSGPKSSQASCRKILAR